MTSYLSSKAPNKDNEISHLKAENHSLKEELTQCQGDKDFVWSLWKRLQVANPDITQAISLIVEKERLKNEEKDNKVLTILRAKDAKIDELQKHISQQSQELSNVITKKISFEDRVSVLERERAELQQRVDELDSNRVQNASREAIRDLDRQNLELKQELHKRNAEIDRIQKDKDDLYSIKDSHRDRINQLEEQLAENKSNADEYNDMKKLLKKYENQLSSQQKQLKAKTEELEKLRREWSSLWTTHKETSDHAAQQTELIHQLQELQQDTHKMVQNTESAYSLEAVTLQNENKSLKLTQDKMAHQIRSQNKTVDELQHVIQDLKHQLEDRVRASGDDYDENHGYDSILHSLQRDVDMLKSNRTFRSRSRSPSPTYNGYSRQNQSSSSARHRRHKSASSAHYNKSTGTNTTKSNKTRSRSLSPHKQWDLKTVIRRLDTTERKLGDTQLLLHLKTKELAELRLTHSNRLERLRSLQSNHKLLKKQIALMDEELTQQQGTRKKKKKITRAEPKSLQKEDSDSVWNELAYFKKQARKLEVENMNLGEECDTLKVQLSQLEATNHELKTCLDHEREELQFMVEENRGRSSTPLPQQEEELAKQQQQLEHYRKHCDRLGDQLERVKSDQKRLEEQRHQISQEKRALKLEINTLKEQESTYRIHIADYKHEIAKLQLEVKKLKKRKMKSPISVSKQYQKTLNKSIREMSGVFDGFSKDGWEEVTESDNKQGNDSTNTTETGQSLGEVIVQQAQSSLHDIEQEEHSFKDPRYSSTPSTSQNTTSCHVTTDPVAYRSIALSPIHFERQRRSIGVSPIQHYSSPVTSHLHKPHVVSKKTGGASSKMVSALRHRVTTLQSQVITLKDTKDAATRNNTELKNTVTQLTADLQAANNKLQTHRHNVQRMTTDLDRLRVEKEALEQRLEDYSVENSANQQSEQEVANLQTRLKNMSNECSKQASQIKDLKAEMVSQQEKISQLQDRNKTLERDNSQKRILVDDIKAKMKIVQENTKGDAKALEEVEEKLRSVTETSNRYKTQVESFKVRLAAVTKEKYDNEDKVIKLSDELERKGRQVSELQCKARSLQSTVAVVEKTAKQQLTSIASQSEAAIDMAQDKLLLAGGKLQEYSKFVKVFAHSLLTSVQHSRHFLQKQEEKLRKSSSQQQHPHNAEADSATSKRFQNMACDILNISESDLKDILNAENTQLHQVLEAKKLEELNKDKQWVKKWEKTIQVQEEFSVPLVEIFMEKIEEWCKLEVRVATS